MAELGNFALLLAAFLALYGTVACIWGAKRNKGRIIASGYNAALASGGFIVLASAALWFALLTSDFRVEYVAAVSSLAQPTIYKFAAFWGSLDGSLLLWELMLCGFTALVILKHRQTHADLAPYAVATLLLNSLFFLSVMLLFANPLAIHLPAPPDGRGLNPLLQNPGMAAHPPTLYIGFVGFAIPYAFCMAALVTGKLTDKWIVLTRRYSLVAWYFLTIGIVFGAQWAYVELGWGGFWAWDPVENASFMPWLTGTAFLHSVMIQEKRGMLKTWNVVLIILTFALCLFGTFLTRSGILSSVHAFSDSNLGAYFLGFIGIMLLVSYGLVLQRGATLRSVPKMESLLSRESSFLFNNLLLVGAAFTVFIGTIFPIIAEAVAGNKVSVGAPFFNTVMGPIMLGIMFLMGVGPLISWRRATLDNLRRNFLKPVVAGLLGGGTLVLFGVRSLTVFLFFGLGVFVLTTVIIELIQGTRGRRSLGEGKVGYAKALGGLVAKNRRRYGGLTVHVGVVMVLVGIIGSAFFSQQTEARLGQGHSINLGNYRLQYDELGMRMLSNAVAINALFTIYNGTDGRAVARMRPEKRFYIASGGEPTTEVAIRSTFREDLYLILSEFDRETQAITVKAVINPLVAWIWVGLGTITLGAVIAIIPSRRRLAQAKES
jgi:cytochrome c-type biogenesis protein CcmF